MFALEKLEMQLKSSLSQHIAATSEWIVIQMHELSFLRKSIE